MEKMVFMVRKAVKEDAIQIQKVSKKAFSQYAENAGISHIVGSLEETCENIERDIQTKLVFVVSLNECIIGSVRVEVKEDRKAYLSRFGVVEDYQNNGIGKMLINIVDETMEKLGIEYLYLHTASRVLSLVRFYYGRGFYIESTSKDKGYIRALLCKEYQSQRSMENEVVNIKVI